MYGHFPVNLRFPVLFLSQLPITGSVKLQLFFTVQVRLKLEKKTHKAKEQRKKSEIMW